MNWRIEEVAEGEWHVKLPSGNTCHITQSVESAVALWVALRAAGQ